jgi:hypothetical protein
MIPGGAIIVNSGTSFYCVKKRTLEQYKGPRFGRNAVFIALCVGSLATL